MTAWGGCYGCTLTVAWWKLRRGFLSLASSLCVHTVRVCCRTSRRSNVLCHLYHIYSLKATWTTCPSGDKVTVHTAMESLNTAWMHSRAARVCSFLSMFFFKVLGCQTFLYRLSKMSANDCRVGTKPQTPVTSINQPRVGDADEAEVIFFYEIKSKCLIPAYFLLRNSKSRVQISLWTAPHSSLSCLFNAATHLSITVALSIQQLISAQEGQLHWLWT